MAEGTQEGDLGQTVPKKKGGRLPLLLALLAMLGAGGFFGLKSLSGGKGSPPKVELGEIVPLSEFLVNLRGNSAYARAEIAVQLRSDYKKESFSKSMEAVRDRIVLLLSSKSLSEVESLEGKMKLKREIAEELNRLLLNSDSEAAKLVTSPEGHDAPEPSAEDPKPPTENDKRSDWESTTGPVLKVFLTSFATQ